MAERRMFTKKITESDAFLDMPCSTQVLYFHLNMAADDDGFINNPKKIQRMVGCSDDDMKVLIMKSFILVFDSGVIVIKHWKMHNYIQSDRYKPTDYIEEKSMLEFKKNKSYTLTKKEDIETVESLENTDENENVYKLDTECVQDVSVGKVRLGKVRLGKVKYNVQQVASLFEHLWKMYPCKKGKGRVSDSDKNIIFDIGIEEMERAIDRYKSDLEKDDWRKPQNGSTFFHSGYIDYLDSNYVPDQKKKTQVKNAFNDFKQNDYNFDEIEKKLLKN